MDRRRLARRRRRPNAPPPPAASSCRRIAASTACSTGAPGADGKSYGIGFALALPGDWNGRLLFQGGGGLNGNVGFPMGAHGLRRQPGARARLCRGQHRHRPSGPGASTPASWPSSRRASTSPIRPSAGSRELAKQIIARHYAKAAGPLVLRRLLDRRPRGDADDAALPALLRRRHRRARRRCGRTSRASATSGWRRCSTRWRRRTPQGVPQVRQALSESDKKLVIDGALNACDANDGVKDGMIFDQLSCKFDPKTLACKGAKTDSCLTMEQAVAIEKGFAGPKDSKGRQVYPGLLLRHRHRVHAGDSRACCTAARTRWARRSRPRRWTWTRARAAAAADPAEALTATSRWTNLNTFSNHGGKLIFFHGVSDPWFSALDTIDYYERMTKANGGAAQVTNWSRLFLVPGMGHCGGGPAALDQFDLLTSLVDWVEKGTAPNAVPATGRVAARPQPSAVRLSAARALQGHRAIRRTRATSSAGTSGGGVAGGLQAARQRRAALTRPSGVGEARIEMSSARPRSPSASWRRTAAAPERQGSSTRGTAGPAAPRRSSRRPARPSGGTDRSGWTAPT